MFRSLWLEARIWPVVWRDRLVTYWLLGEKEHWLFLALVALVMVGALSTIGFACIYGTRIESTRIEVLQRQSSYEMQRASELQCLAENIYFEARGEPVAGQYAVAEVTVNRTHARSFPHDICLVVHETRWDPIRRRFVADFSWTERGALFPEDGPAWRQAMAVANEVYEDLHEPVVPGALFYHATNVRPSWARTKRVIATIGNHVFYR
jgi:N-acetylmuramoyl-L-alanine amidase